MVRLTEASYHITSDSLPKTHEGNIMQPLQENIAACIVLPTYNEAQNITRVLDLIFQSEAVHQATSNGTHRVSISVLVVDDNSPDGTSDLVKIYQEHNKNVYLFLRKEKSGLGAAYIAGMQLALMELRPDVILEMDADLSHNPVDIFRMLNDMHQFGADVVIGSRYVKDGSTPKDWGVHRKITSAVANIMARSVISGRSIMDCTSGFRAIRSTLLRKINFTQLDVKGYAFQISLLESLLKQGAIVYETPIHFVDRVHGKSKLQITDVLELGLFVARLGAQKAAAPIIQLGKILSITRRDKGKISPT